MKEYLESILRIKKTAGTAYHDIERADLLDALDTLTLARDQIDDLIAKIHTVRIRTRGAA